MSPVHTLSSIDESLDSVEPALDVDDIPRPSRPIIEQNVEDLSSEAEILVPLESEDGAPRIKARPYQTEMVEESLKRNIIVAMDTGSGKTHVAIMRMKYELERIPAHQIIWFLAPTVSLCEQQLESIKTQIGFVESKMFSGEDNVDCWTHQGVWDAALMNVRIVVSTPKVLLDALSHGLVRMESLGMLVFDEAHNCVGKDSGAKIMQLFYHKRRAHGLYVPHVLGLTASPVMRSKASSVVKIEQTLDALCRTPTKHRAELRMQVNLPVLTQILYEPASALKLSTSVANLQQVYAELKLNEDPYYLSLVGATDDRGRRQFEKLMCNFKTKSREQLKSFLGIAQKISLDLGHWAVDHYVSEVVNRETKTQSNGSYDNPMWGVDQAEKLYVAKALKQVKLVEELSLDDISVSTISDKVRKLIEVLLLEPETSLGIVFVQERATAVILAHLLTEHPLTCERLKVGTFVGTSASSHRNQSISDLTDPKLNKEALSNFRSGKTNLIIATSVLEEGIDVPQCSLVVCFQKPSNLKSFVQRRGRARHRDSKLILLSERTLKDKLMEFQQLEADMRAMYEDEMRELREVLVDEDSEEVDNRTYVVEKTGAVLDLDNAVSHLYHFCATLPVAQYVDLRPDFICNEEHGLIKAKVILPLSVNEAVRTAQSRTEWKSEKNAIKDAAFEAYVALHKAGLISDNLLPVMRKDDLLEDLQTKASDTRASFMQVREQQVVWQMLARAWNKPDTERHLYLSTITLDGLEMDMILPLKLPPIPAFVSYWNANIEVRVIFDAKSTIVDSKIAGKFQDDTWTLLQAAYGHRFPIRRGNFVVPFSAAQENIQDIPAISPWTLADYASLDSLDLGLIRDTADPNVAYIYQGLLSERPALTEVQTPYQLFDSTAPDTEHVSVARVGKSHGVLRRPTGGQTSTKPFSAVIPVTRCRFDSMPFKYVRCALLMPSILHQLELYLLARDLSQTVLRTVAFSDLDLVLEAICSSHADVAKNYQRLEFIGDSILKLCTSIQMMDEQPFYHEGYLSLLKDRIVSNTRLSRAALEAGLDKYIITKNFSIIRWRPSYVDGFSDLKPDATRLMSTKVLADVVESLTGAAMLDGGFPKALRCLQVFIPEIDWQPLEQRRSSLYQRVRDDILLPEAHHPVEEILGYTFTKKALLVEALTYPSCIDSKTGSFERLEFLGDAILDNIVATAMLPYNLSHVKMHYLRTAVVGADFLAFVCMEFSTCRDTISLEEDKIYGPGQITFKENHVSMELPLWKFLRHMSPEMGLIQTATAKRHALLREEIKGAIGNGKSVPWLLLSQLQARKFYSDIIESVIGAVWIDSGSLEVCTQLVEKMGILPYLRRLVTDNVHLYHPKEELGILAVDKKVKYVLFDEKKPETKGVDGEEKELRCRVEVGGVEITRVGGGLNKEEVMTKAAEAACEVLRKQKLADKEKIVVLATDENTNVEMGGT